jgi:GR25 family glycosyltransferase involved in LPS biosynthesis
MELFEHTLFINLDHRTDRLEHINKEFDKLGITAERVPAIRAKSPAIGCTLSHIKCLELAKSRGYEEVFVCEDDITFVNPALFQKNLATFVANKEIHWNVLIIGGNNVPPYQQVYEYCARVFSCQTTTGYVVKREYYDTLINNFKEGLSHFIKNPTNGRMFAVDIYWKRLQTQDYWYMITPPTVSQYDNYSDIEDRVTQYGGLLLDMEKTWYVKQQDQFKMQLTKK